MNIIGDVDGRTCILIDDIVDSAGTLCNAAAALKQQGAAEVFAYCTHGVLSGGAVARVGASELSRAGGHRFDLHRRGRPQGRQDPPADHRAAARRSDPADFRRSQRVEPVRLEPMCNLYRLREEPGRDPAAVRRRRARSLDFPEGMPNLTPTDVRHHRPRADRPAARRAAPSWSMRRWSWPQRRRRAALQPASPTAAAFDERRCLAIADGFYEYTTPADPKAKRKDRWLFQPAEGELIGDRRNLARPSRSRRGVHPATGRSRATDVKPCHHRQIVLIPPQRWADWLDAAVAERGDMCLVDRALARHSCGRQDRTASA